MLDDVLAASQAVGPTVVAGGDEGQGEAVAAALWELDERPIREEYLIVDAGRLAGAGAHSYSAGDATGGSEEATRFKAR